MFGKHICYVDSVASIGCGCKSKCRTFLNLNIRKVGYVSPTWVQVQEHVLNTCIIYCIIFFRLSTLNHTEKFSLTPSGLIHVQFHPLTFDYQHKTTPWLLDQSARLIFRSKLTGSETFTTVLSVGMRRIGISR